MLFVLLVLIVLVSLWLVPLGLPGIWIMLAAAIVHDLVAMEGRIGWVIIGSGVALAVVAEVLEFTLSSRYARKYGGSRRAGWGAIIGGIAGAIVGLPVPVLGSMFGAFVGAFLGALVAEYSRREATAGSASRVATGALLGRVAATVIKVSLAVVIAAMVVISAWR